MSDALRSRLTLTESTKALHSPEWFEPSAARTYPDATLKTKDRGASMGQEDSHFGDGAEADTTWLIIQYSIVTVKLHGARTGLNTSALLNARPHPTSAAVQQLDDAAKAVAPVVVPARRRPSPTPARTAVSSKLALPTNTYIRHLCLVLINKL